MKISETSWWQFAIVEWIECRLTTRLRSKEVRELKKNLWAYEIVNGIYYDTKWYAIWWATILIPTRAEKVEKKMRALWYTDFDYDSKPYALVKCYK